MSIQRCQLNKKIGWRHGKGGQCYTGPDCRSMAETDKKVYEEKMAKASMENGGFGIRGRMRK